ncbi:MAG: copper chaperone PCu(A)C [Proteobacteria bacterium]|nr:copper chaperone PCu(A)C [Pseudomonadota bacterium]
MKILNIRLICFIVIFCVFEGTALAGGPKITVSESWIREAPPGAGMMAGYMNIKNNTSKSIMFKEAISSEFESIMIHQSVMKDGMMQMHHLSNIAIAPGKTLIFEPGGLHLMLMNPNKALKEGDVVKIKLLFNNGVNTVSEFKVKKN